MNVEYPRIVWILRTSLEYPWMSTYLPNPLAKYPRIPRILRTSLDYPRMSTYLTAHGKVSADSMDIPDIPGISMDVYLPNPPWQSIRRFHGYSGHPWISVAANLNHCVQEDASAKMLGYHVLLSASVVDYVILILILFSRT